MTSIILKNYTYVVLLCFSSLRVEDNFQRMERLLDDIFGGPSIAARLVSTARRSVEGYGRGVKRAAPISDVGAERVEVKETKRFAGRDIEVTRTVVGSRAGGGVPGKGGGGGGSGGGGDGSRDGVGGAAVPVKGTADGGGSRRPAPAGIDSLLS